MRIAMGLNVAFFTGVQKREVCQSGKGLILGGQV
jgi:hypothetical protein